MDTTTLRLDCDLRTVLENFVCPYSTALHSSIDPIILKGRSHNYENFESEF